jgi:ABC-type antimicrobial peptide transport system permease subunit
LAAGFPSNTCTKQTVGAFAGIAALMAALGLYGVLAHAVTEQRREIGIRMALGARPGDVVSHTLRSALSMLLVGLAVGLAGAFALTRALKSLLFEVSALDPAALALACVLMTLVGILTMRKSYGFRTFRVLTWNLPEPETTDDFP